MMLKYLRRLIICLIFTWSLSTCNLPTEPEIAREPVKAQILEEGLDLSQLGQALQKLAKDPKLRSGQLAFSLKKVNSGEVLMEHYPHKTMVPASCLKALTTATGLGVLGKDFQFKTRLEYSGEIKDQQLLGDLIIRGGGDPTLSSRIMKTKSLSAVLKTWTEKLKALGIREVKGDILVDESAFFGDISPAHWIWGDMGNYFGAPAGAINVYDNTYRLYFQPRTIGKKAKILRTEPRIEDMQFINEVKTAGPGTGDQASISGAPYDPVRYVSGTVPFVPSGGQFTIKGSIPDPAMYLARTWKQQLISLGIVVKGQAITSRLLQLDQKPIPKNGKLIAQETSPSLLKIVNNTNWYSINLFAEAILKQIGREQQDEASTRAGVEAMAKFWQNKGIADEGVYLQDGSGLSLSNGVTADYLSEVFCKMKKENYFQDFYNSLPVAGISGTMKTVGRGTAMQNNLRAKTGGMTRVLAYVGYFTTKSGELMSFSLLANQYQGSYAEMKKKMIDLMVAMVGI